MVTINTIDLGQTANDGTGDTLRGAGQKINDNFTNLATFLGDIDAGIVKFTSTGLKFEGQNHDTYLNFDEDINGDHTLNLPASTSTLVTEDAEQNLINKTFLDLSFKASVLDTNTLSIIVDDQLLINKIARIDLSNLDSDHFVFADVTATLRNKTLDLPFINNPYIDKIRYTGGTTVLEFEAEAGSQQHVFVSNIADNSGISIRHNSNTSANVDLNVSAQNNGVINVTSIIAQEKEIITENGFISLSKGITEINSESNLSGLTLPVGNVIGSKKTLINTNSGEAAITLTNDVSVGSDTYIIMKQHAVVEAIWTGDRWMINTPKLYTSADDTLWHLQ